LKETEQPVTRSVELSIAKTAPPLKEAEFEVIVQTDVVTVECASAVIAPPVSAKFEVIVQKVLKTVESPFALKAPPKI
jgi:hypothetical protein